MEVENGTQSRSTIRNNRMSAIKMFSNVANCLSEITSRERFLGPNPKGWGPIDSGCPSVRLSVGPSVRLSVCPSVIDSFPGCIFVTNGRRDLGIGSYERSRPVDVPFDSFGQIWSPEMAEFGQNVQK